MSDTIKSRNDKQNWPDNYRNGAASARNELIRGFYEAGCPEPGTPIRDVPLLALDFETNGLDADRHSIVSIGLVPGSRLRRNRG